MLTLMGDSQPFDFFVSYMSAESVAEWIRMDS
jgi:hypothetical protein